MLPISKQLNPKPILTPKLPPPMPAGASSAVQPAIIKTACSWTHSSKDQLLLDKLELLKGVNLNKVQIFKIMLQDKIKGQYNKQLKSNREIFINILFKDINNNPNLIYIREINLNRIQKRRYFNALINPILTNKELEDKHKDKIKKVNQEVNYLKNVREVYINSILQVKTLQFLLFLLTIYNTL